MPVEIKSDQWVKNGVRSQTILFSHVDSAGIVFYPRYLELLADSFPGWFPSRFPFRLDLEFKNPMRLGETVEFRSQASANLLSVQGKSRTQVSFTARLELLQSLHLDPSPSIDPGFCTVRSVPDWMTGAHSLLHLSRYFELVSWSIEKWFAEALDYPFHHLHLRDFRSVPTVKLETELVELPRADDEISMQLRVLQVGSKSVRLKTLLVREDRVLAQTTQVLVFSSNFDGELQSAVIPPELMCRLKSQIFHGRPL